MEENVNEALGIGGSDAQKKDVQKKSDENSAEKTLQGVATFIMICGIISTIICLFSMTFIDVDTGYHKETVFNPSGFAVTVGVLLSTLISWSTMMVLANISLTLKDIKKKMK